MGRLILLSLFLRMFKIIWGEKLKKKSVIISFCLKFFTDYLG